MKKFVAVLLVLLTPALLVAQEFHTVSPEQVASFLKKGEKVKLVLKTGTYGEGKVEEVSAATLKLNVKKSDNVRDLATGIQDVSFERLASVTISSYKGNKRTWLPFILVSTLGALGSVVAIGSASEEGQGAYIPLGLGFAAGLGVGGYFAGRTMDRKDTTLTLR